MRDKENLRKALRRMRFGLDEAMILSASSAIQNSVIDCEIFQKARHVMAYAPIQNEVHTKDLICAAFKNGKDVYLPRVKSDQTMEAAPVLQMDDPMNISSFGILEPNESMHAVRPDLLDLVIVPGIAFDSRGYRIGFGKGYYDRFIPLLRPDCIKIALAYDFQIVDAVPNDPYDTKVDFIITEKRLIQCEESNDD